MSMETQAGAEFTLNKPTVVVFRNFRRCLYWVAFVVGGGLASLLVAKLRIAGVGLCMFSLQALVADWCGVRISDTELSAPRRYRQFGPLFVFWRSHGDLADIEALTSISTEGNGGVVHLRWMHGATIKLFFPNRKKKLEFFQTIRQFRPDIGIYRDDN